MSKLKKTAEIAMNERRKVILPQNPEIARNLAVAPYNCNQCHGFAKTKTHHSREPEGCTLAAAGALANEAVAVVRVQQGRCTASRQRKENVKNKMDSCVASKMKSMPNLDVLGMKG
jgi:hypothetical protein